MAIHDLVLGGSVLRTRDFGSDTPPALSPNKGKWLLHTEAPRVGYQRRGTPVIGANGVTYPAEDWTDQEVVDGLMPQRIAEIKNTEGLPRLQAVMAAIQTWDQVELIREQWLSVAPAARAPTATFQSLIDIYQAGRDAVIAVKAMDRAQLEAYNAATDPAWPA